MKRYIKPQITIEYIELRLLIGKQSGPKNAQGSGDIFSNYGGFDDGLYDTFAKPGGELWDEDEDDL
jgi:hypothetical protein